MRSFVIILAAVASLFSFASVRVLAARPIGVVSPHVDQVYRGFESPTRFDVSTEWGDAYYLEFIGDRFDSSQEAVDNFDFFTTYLPESLPEILVDLVHQNLPDNPVQPGSPRIVTVSLLGDEAFAIEIVADLGLLADERILIVLIRQDKDILTTTAATHDMDADLLGMLVSIVTPTLDRWALNDPIHVDETGVRSGGIWNMVPNPDEIPEGFVLDETYEEGPGPQRSEQIPKPTSLPPLLPTPIGDSPATNNDGTRLAQPFDATIRIILANDTFSAAGQGDCVGQGRYSYLHEEGLIALKTADGGDELVLVRGFQPGRISYDLQLQADVCVFEIGFRGVPPRAGYLLIAGDAPITRFTYEELSSGSVPEVVIEH